MMKLIFALATAAALLCMGACGKKGPLSLPPGVEKLPEDPSQRDDPPL